MKILGLGVTLEKLEPKHLELLRTWRNDSRVNRFLLDKRQITPQQQTKWYNSLDEDTNLHMMVYTECQPVGMIALKEIDWNKMSGTTVLLIGQTNARNKPWSVLAAMLFSEFSFEVVGLKQIISDVFIENSAAVQLNKLLGFKSISRASENIMRQTSTQSSFKEAISPLRSKIEKSFGAMNQMRVELSLNYEKGRISEKCLRSPKCTIVNS